MDLNKNVVEIVEKTNDIATMRKKVGKVIAAQLNAIVMMADLAGINIKDYNSWEDNIILDSDSFYWEEDDGVVYVRFREE